MNVNIPELADTLFERTTNTSWVVVFKSLTTTHQLMVYGNEVRTAFHLLLKWSLKKIKCLNVYKKISIKLTEFLICCFFLLFFLAEIYTVSGFKEHIIQPQ